MNKIITKEAKEALAKEAKFAKLIEICGDINEPSLEEDYLQSLLSSVIGQQLSGKVADTIWKRFKNYLDDEITAQRVLFADNEALRALGISYSKIGYLKSIATAVVNKTLDLENINNYCDEEIISQLVKIKGVGRWTAEMFLIFSLGRSDVYSLGDGGLTRAVKNLYSLEKEPTKAQLIEISSKWTPFRTAASLYLWRSLEKDIAALLAEKGE